MRVEAERPSHAATAGVERLDVGARLSQQRFLVGHLHHRLVMAVSVEHDLACDLRRGIARRFSLEKLTQQERLRAQLFRPRVSRKQIAQLIAEHRRAARFEDDDRNAGIDEYGQRREHLLQILLRLIEHPEVIQRPPAAQPALRDKHMAAGGAQHVVRRTQRLGMK